VLVHLPELNTAEHLAISGAVEEGEVISATCLGTPSSEVAPSATPALALVAAVEVEEVVLVGLVGLESERSVEIVLQEEEE
jgi:hypothetical protein